MSKQIEFLERCKKLGLHDGSLFDWMDRIESLERQLAERDADCDEFQSVITATGKAATGYDFNGGLAEYVEASFKQLATVTAQRDLLGKILSCQVKLNESEACLVYQDCYEALASLKGE